MVEQPVNVEPRDQNAAGQVPVEGPEVAIDNATVHDYIELERIVGLELWLCMMFAFAFYLVSNLLYDAVQSLPVVSSAC